MTSMSVLIITAATYLIKRISLNRLIPRSVIQSSLLILNDSDLHLGGLPKPNRIREWPD